MKRLLAISMSVLMLSVFLAGCSHSNTVASSGTGDNEPAQASKVLKVWSFTNEMKVFSTAFKKAHPDVQIENTMVAMDNGDYQAKLQQALATGIDIPDVFCMDASFVRQYVESDFVMDLSDLLSKAKELGAYQFMLDAGTNAQGQTVAYSYQATPGAMFYRRSLAKEYLGTDDPAKVQAMVSSMPKFLDVAKTIKEKSNGNTYMIASTGDLNNSYFSNRQKPWVVNNTLTVDPIIEEYWNTAKICRQEGYEAQATQWGEGWFAGMNDTLKDAQGNSKQIFCYMLPTWGLSYVLEPHAKSDTTDTTGDWACIEGPMPYQWGGTWLAVPKKSENPELAKQFVEFVCMNEQTLEDWATGTYTNEYLKAIDPDIGDLFQPAGDFVNSQKVVEKIVDDFDQSESSKFLGGQNAYAMFAEIAPNVSLKVLQGTDDAIQRAMSDPLENYVSGSISKEEMIETWKQNVKIAVPDIQVD